jgi:hypothetical protein
VVPGAVHGRDRPARILAGGPRRPGLCRRRLRRRPVRAGGTAGQEWIPAGTGRAFAATVGCAEHDGSFTEFLAGLAEPDFALGDGVSWTARDGRWLVLPAAGSFTVDGAAPDIGPDGRPDISCHLENPACTARFGDETLTAEYGGHRMVLDIARARRA